MGIVFLEGYCVNLSSNLTTDATVLPILSTDVSYLSGKLGEDGHSYLVIKGTLGKSETVKIAAADGAIFIERGDNPISASKGKCACFQITKEVLDDYGMGEPCELTFKVNEDSVDWIVIEDTGCDEDNKREITIGINQAKVERLEGCCPEDDCNTCTLNDGVYENATVTVRNGRLCVVENGKNVIYTGGSTCCNCQE